MVRITTVRWCCSGLCCLRLWLDLLSKLDTAPSRPFSAKVSPRGLPVRLCFGCRFLEPYWWITVRELTLPNASVTHRHAPRLAVDDGPFRPTLTVTRSASAHWLLSFVGGRFDFPVSGFRKRTRRNPADRIGVSLARAIT